MVRRDLIRWLAGTGLAVAMGAPASGAWASSPAQPGTAPAPRGPNIIFIVADQLRAAFTKAQGYPFDTMPAVDALAAAGARFPNAYATFPACVPSRTSMLTGRWPEAHRVRMNNAADDAYYSSDVYDVAKAQGYRTGLAGKNHTYRKPESLDFWREYSHVAGYIPPNSPPAYAAFDAWMRKLGAPNMSLEPTPFPLEVQYPVRIVNDAIEFIESSGSKPFLLQVSFPEPHAPQQVPQPYWDMFPPDKVPERKAGPEALAKLGFRARWLYDLEQLVEEPDDRHWRRYVATYLGQMRMVDDQIARLIAHLRKTGRMNNTLIVFLADHGDYVMDYGLGRKGVGIPEALIRIPMVFAGAGVRRGSGLDGVFTSNADVMPTLCEAMGAGIPIGVQGRSLWPLLRGEPYPAEEFRSIYAGTGLGGLFYDEADAAAVAPKRSAATRTENDTLNKVTQAGYQKMVRMGPWKLIYDMMGYGQLYHLPSDPLELDNRFGKPDVAKPQAALMAELAMWTIRSQDSLPTGPQNAKYQTKWARPHNWYAPYRHGQSPEAYVP